MVPLLQSRDTDFTAYFKAAGALAEGTDPYLDRAHPYLYPPLLAVVLMPFRGLPASAAAGLWSGRFGGSSRSRWRGSRVGRRTAGAA